MVEKNFHKAAKFFGPALLIALSVQVLPSAAQVFTSEQASAGRGDYNGQCAMCHGTALLGPDAPALVGKEVMHNFDTAAGLYDYFSLAMPPQAPGLLDEKVYVNIMAYILEANGAVAGDTPLTADPDLLENIKLAEVTSQAVAPAETTTEAPTGSDIPQAFTWGKTLPSLAPVAAPQQTPAIPQAYTWGKTLPKAN